MLTNIANIQASKGLNVTILSINDKIDDRLASLLHNVRLLHVKKEGSKSPLDLVKLNYLIYKVSPDVIHLHDRNIAKYILPIFKKNCFLTIHNSLTEGVDYSSLKKFHHVFAISHTVNEQLHQRGINSVCVMNGIDFGKFQQRENNVIGGKIKAVQVSRLYCKQKGQDILLNAMSIARKEYNLDVDVDFIGGGEDLECLKGKALDLNLTDHIRFLGVKSQEYVADNLKNYDLFIQPSRFEGFGLTVVEAMAAKVPVLVSRNEGPWEILDEGRYGFAFNNGDAEDCARKLFEFSQKGDLTYFVQQAYNHAKSNYSIENTVEEYIEQYKKIIG